MKKMVGVMPLWDDEKESIWMLPAYIEGLNAAGMDSVIFPMTRDEDEVKRLIGFCDQILLTGGHDVNPSLYHEVNRLNGMRREMSWKRWSYPMHWLRICLSWESAGDCRF